MFRNNSMIHNFDLLLLVILLFFDLCILTNAYVGPTVQTTTTTTTSERGMMIGIDNNHNVNGGVGGEMRMKNNLFLSTSSIVCCKMTESDEITNNDSSKNSNNKNKNVQDLMESASRLRREAEFLEEEMSKKRTATTNKGGTSTNLSPPQDVSYTSLKDSKWTISYRFASDPLSTSEEEEENQKDGEAQQQPKKLIFYSGKVTILFRADGYTDIVTLNDENSSNSLKITKFWGWDAEIDQEDGLKYLAYSADIILPKSDPNYSGDDSTPTRFYFNNRIDTDEKSNIISLSDGKVTVKRNIEPPGSFWSIFKTEGILAQFRYCGDFISKPTK